VDGNVETLRRALPQGAWPKASREPDEVLIEKGAALLVAQGARAVSPEDPDYPRGLPDLHTLATTSLGSSDPRIRRAAEKCSPVVFLRGPWKSRRIVAIVGSRSATLDGIRVARDLAAVLAEHDVAVVSGLARGIDAAAHEGALGAGGLSGAVLGTSLHACSPRAHAALQERLASSLGLMTEIFPGSQAHPGSFSVRNHLLAAIADATVVVQGNKSSGSLITAGAAHAMGRPVGAVPWDIYEALGAGCHLLVREGRAALIRGPEDALALLGLEPSRHSAPQTLLASESLGERESRALASIGRLPRSFDDVAAASGLSASELGAAIVELELLGLARREAGGRVRRAAGV
jgi:DNA processing protein